jgi:threonine dehydrogenase-like Zn-dependent dehydrogenase
MQRAVWTPDGLVVEECEPGPLADGWARLRVEGCGICGTDLHLADGQLPRPLGTVPGHEFVGTLLAAPAGTPDVRYAGSPMVVCGTCEHCAADELNLCRRGGDLIGIGRDGGLASWVDVPVANLVPLPTDVGPGVGLLAEPMAVAVRGVGHARLGSDDTALVLGAGTIGLLTAAVARTRTDRVVISARHAHQRAVAETLGLDVIDESEVQAWGKAEKPRAVLETVGGTATTLDTAVSVVRRGGTIVILGTFPRREVDLFVAALKEITLLPSYAYATTDGDPDFARAAATIAELRDVLPAVVTHRLPLDDVSEAFRIAADKSTGAVKVALTP